MKTGLRFLFVSVILFAACERLHGQGTVSLANNTSSRIMNGLTGMPAAPPISVAMYYAPDGETNETLFTQVGPSTQIIGSGIFSGGKRTVPTPVPGGHAMIQIRAFEGTYGTTYEQAVAAGPQNGRYALSGKSLIMRIDTGDPTTTPPQTSASLACCFQGITVHPGAYALPQLRISEPIVLEGDSGTTDLVFDVTLVGGSNQVVTVDYATADNTASSGSDYTTASGTLTFEVGETNKQVVVAVQGDTNPENDEVVLLQLGNAANAILVDVQGAGTIYNDDCATSVALALYPGVTINGCVGKPYDIQVAFESNPTQWSTVTNFVLPSTPYLWFDTISPLTGGRYYRTVLLLP